jgi:hypothetical protein
LPKFLSNDIIRNHLSLSFFIILAAGMSVLKLVDGNDIGLPNEARIAGF